MMENIEHRLDVVDLLMYLFENYMVEETNVTPTEESLHNELQEAGFTSNDVDKAFRWLDDLASKQKIKIDGDISFTLSNSTRFLTTDELNKLTVEAQGLFINLQQAGVLDSETRELVLDRVMALDSTEIDAERLRWLTLLVLFNHPGQEAAYAWMEGMVYDDMPNYLN